MVEGVAAMTEVLGTPKSFIFLQVNLSRFEKATPGPGLGGLLNDAVAAGEGRPLDGNMRLVVAVDISFFPGRDD